MMVEHISLVASHVDFIQSLDKNGKAEEASFKILPKEKEEMLTLPKGIIHVLRQFEAVLSERVWEWAKVLVIGAILAPGERTVAARLPPEASIVIRCARARSFL